MLWRVVSPCVLCLCVDSALALHGGVEFDGLAAGGALPAIKRHRLAASAI